MQTKSVVDKTCGHGALPVGGFMATPIGAHVLSFCQKYPSAGRTSFALCCVVAGQLSALPHLPRSCPAILGYVKVNYMKERERHY